MNAVVPALHSIVLAAGLAVAALCEAPGAHAPLAYAALGLLHFFLFWRTHHGGHWAGTAVYATLAASWFLPFLPGIGSPYPPTRFLVLIGSAAHLAGGEWGTAIRRPWAAALFVLAWLVPLAWRAHNLVDALAYGYDLAHVQNLLVNTLDGRFLYSDYTQGSILSHHLFLSLTLLVPLYAAWPHPLTLQLAQIVLMGAAVGLTAAAAARRFGSETALPALLVFLCHPAFAGQALHEFDPGILGLFGVALAAWGWSRDRGWALWTGVAVALGAKEHFAVAAVVAGALMAFNPASRRNGMILAAIGLMVGGAFGAYAFTSDDPFSLRTQLEIRFNENAPPVRLTAGRVGYLLHLLLPSGGLAILGLPLLLPALLEPALNLLSRFPMASMTAHYHVLTLPFLSLATAAGIARLGEWRPAWGETGARFAAASALLAALLSQIGPISQSLAMYDIIRKPQPRYAEWKAFVADLPQGDVAVVSGYRLLTLLPDRRPIIPLPYIDLSETIASRPVVILEDARDTPPPGAQLVKEREGLRVYTRDRVANR